MAQLCLHCLKKAGAGTRHPLPSLSCRCVGWNVPGSGEPAEMIHADHIYMIQQGTQPIDTPTITSRPQGVPVVNGIAPQLTLRAEIVGGNPGDKAWPTSLIEQEEFRVSPNVTGIRGDEKGQITDQAHALGVSVFFELIGLAEQEELRKANLIDFTCQLAPRLGEAAPAALNQIRWPFEIISILILGFQRSE